MELSGSSISILVSSLFYTYLLFSLSKFLHQVWWYPLGVQKRMRSQGINGPSYRFYYGSSKEILKMEKKSGKSMKASDHHIFPNIQPHFYSWMKIYGETFVYWIGPKAEVVTTDLKILKQVMNEKDGAYDKTDVEGYFKVLLGDGIVKSKGEKWVAVRKLANHAFNAESLKNMTPVMVSSVEMMLERWKQHEGNEIEVFEEFKLLTSEIISRTAFGSSYADGEDIFQNITKLRYLISQNRLKFQLPILRVLFKNQDDIEVDKIDQVIRASVLEIIRKREKETGNNFGHDYLGSLMMKANHDVNDGYKITIDDIVDECKTLYLAGQETTTSLLAWGIFLLAIHTEWQEKAREEVFKLLGAEHPSSDTLSRMKMINMILNETLRLYPPVTSLVRKSKHNVNLGKFIVPGNVRFHFPVLSLHQDTQVWGDDAHLFKPERFAEGVAKATNNNPGAFLPFGFGPRNCVGSNFAMNEAKIAMSMILQRFSFTLSPTYCHAPHSVLTVCPKFGVQVILHHL